MKRRTVLYLVFVLLLVSWLVSSITGVVLWLSPLGGGAKRGLRRLPGYQLHVYAGLVSVFLCVVHAALNWRWIVSATKGAFGRG